MDAKAKQWRLIYRASMGCGLSIFLICCVITSGYAEKTFIYLTYWSFSAICLYHLVALANIWSEEKVEEHHSTCETVLCTIANGAAPIVTLLFWITEYDGSGLTTCNFTLHMVNSVLALIDLLLMDSLLKFRNWILTTCYGLSYATFTVIYWLCGGENHKGEPYIYKVLDYTGHPLKATIFLSLTCLVGAPLSQLLLVSLQKLFRKDLHHKIRKLRPSLSQIL